MPRTASRPAAWIAVATAAFLAVASARAATAALMLTVQRNNTHRGSGANSVRLVQLEINVRSAATNTINAQLEWYFVASPIGGFGYYIGDKGTQPLKIAPRQAVTVVKDTPRIKEKPAKGGVQKAAEITGYIVRVTAGGKVVAMTGAPSFLERKAENPEEFNQLLSNSGP